MNSIWLMIGKNTFMCPVCKAQITGDENIKYQRYCYWCGTKMTQDEEAENEVCCNCKHNIRTGEAPDIESHCELDGSYIGYVKCMEYRCEHWEEEEK